MSYEDLLKKYQRLDRTRIFGADWRITQQWTSLHVPWSADYHQTRFSINVAKTTPVVIVLSQLDSNYFCGLEGQYQFKLQFRVQKVGDDEDYIVRNNVDYYMTRSASTDIILEAGSYHLLMKITAEHNGGRAVNEVIAENVEHKRDKLIQVGLSYDIAHAKGVIVETEKETERRESAEKAQKAAIKETLKNEAKADAKKRWTKQKKLQWRRDRREKFADEKATRLRLNERADGYTDDKVLPAQPGHDSNDIGIESEQVGGDRSSTGEFIAAYERSEGAPSPVAAGPGDPVNEPSANGTDHPLESPADETTNLSLVNKASEHHPPTPTVQINGVDAVTDVKPLKRRPAPLTAERKPDQTFDETDQAQQEDERPDEPFKQPQWSPTETASEFEWQTELDYDSECGRKRYAESEGPREMDRDEDIWPEPWNAVCVVGLRVYSKDPDLSIEVVRPNPYSDEVKQDAGEVLDRDDPAKGAVAEKWARTPMRQDFDLN